MISSVGCLVQWVDQRAPWGSIQSIHPHNTIQQHNQSYSNAPAQQRARGVVKASLGTWIDSVDPTRVDVKANKAGPPHRHHRHTHRSNRFCSIPPTHKTEDLEQRALSKATLSGKQAVKAAAPAPKKQQVAASKPAAAVPAKSVKVSKQVAKAVAPATTAAAIKPKPGEWLSADWPGLGRRG
jgi:hypothetical protein